MFGQRQDVRALLDDKQFERLLTGVVERLNWTRLDSLIRISGGGATGHVSREAIKIENLTVHLDGEGSKLIAEAIADRLVPSMVVPLPPKEAPDESDG